MYYLKTVTDTYSKIQRGRVACGFVRKNETGWVACIDKETTTHHATAKAAFHEIVKIANRISLCGTNDEQAARDEVGRRNQEVRDEVERMRSAGVNVGIKSRRFTI
jgi:hypothetical protein